MDDGSRGSAPQWNRQHSPTWSGPRGEGQCLRKEDVGLVKPEAGVRVDRGLEPPRAHVVTLWVMGRGEGRLPGGTPEQLVGHRGPGGWAALREAHPRGSHPHLRLRELKVPVLSFPATWQVRCLGKWQAEATEARGWGGGESYQ